MLTIKPEDIAALIEAFERCSSQEIRIATADFELQMSKTADGRLRPFGGRCESSATGRAASDVQRAEPSSSHGSVQSVAAGQAEPLPIKSPSPADSGLPTLGPGEVFVRAANLGTFYRSSKPGAPAYVDIGSHVSPDTEVCLVEVMKLFTPMQAGVSGVVRKVLAQDGQLVEFDQPLFVVELDA